MQKTRGSCSLEARFTFNFAVQKKKQNKTRENKHKSPTTLLLQRRKIPRNSGPHTSSNKGTKPSLGRPAAQRWIPFECHHLCSPGGRNQSLNHRSVTFLRFTRTPASYKQWLTAATNASVQVSKPTIYFLSIVLFARVLTNLFISKVTRELSP